MSADQLPSPEVPSNTTPLEPHGDRSPEGTSGAAASPEGILAAGQEAVAGWYDFLAGLPPAAAPYRHTAIRFLNWLVRCGTALSDVTPEIAERFLSGLEVSAGSKNGYRTMLRRFFDPLVVRGVLLSHPIPRQRASERPQTPENCNPQVKSPTPKTHPKHNPLLLASRRREEELRTMSDKDLNAVATTVLGPPPSSDITYTSWTGFGLIIEAFRQQGCTLRFTYFDLWHLDWMNSLPGNIRRNGIYLTAEVEVIDLHGRLRLAPDENCLNTRAETLPRAAAIAAVLNGERQLAALQPNPIAVVRNPWDEDRRRQQSERMKAYWQKRNGLVADALSEDA